MGDLILGTILDVHVGGTVAIHVTSCNDQNGDIDRLTGGKRVVGSTATLKTRAVLKRTYLVPQLLLSRLVAFRLDKFRKSDLAATLRTRPIL